MHKVRQMEDEGVRESYVHRLWDPPYPFDPCRHGYDHPPYPFVVLVLPMLFSGFQIFEPPSDSEFSLEWHARKLVDIDANVK